MLLEKACDNRIAASMLPSLLGARGSIIIFVEPNRVTWSCLSFGLDVGLSLPKRPMIGFEEPEALGMETRLTMTNDTGRGFPQGIISMIVTLVLFAIPAIGSAPTAVTGIDMIFCIASIAAEVGGALYNAIEVLRTQTIPSLVSLVLFWASQALNLPRKALKDALRCVMHSRLLIRRT